jgi:hypothetical protein
MRKQKIISIFEMFMMILSLFAFSFLVAETNIKEVSASDQYPSGCCLESQTGSICQEMNLLDSKSCKTDLVGTSCKEVQQCQTGCCYNSNAGVCSLNAPKEKCEISGGNWSSDANCNIEQCQIGCCILGDGASMSTTRECTLMSQKYGIEKIFKPLDSIGSCSSYTGLSEEGACLTASTDFSSEKSCTFTTKGKCSGEFKQGYLCTSKELNTSCDITEKTSCIDGKDEVYFIDSCGNRANIYDATKAKNQTYWEKFISPDKSCSTQSSTCGNCDYSTGSVCSVYKTGDVKPQLGTNTCKNLNCGDKKHGESWCVYDTNPNKIAPVGSRQFVASCIEGEISIEGCADFNQEICAQNTDTGAKRTQAKCLVNDWRSCLNANEKESYQEVAKECNRNPQCMMFNDYFGQEKLKRSDGTFFSGFKEDADNSEQGSIGDQGKDQNKVLAHCVPRFTPGFQFWTTTSNPITGTSGTASSSNYGGDAAEAGAVCSLGNFFCMSEKHRDCTLGGGCESWDDDSRNWECNFDAGNHEAEVRGKDLPNLLAALNERCRSIGTCGVSSNIAGQINSQDSGVTITRVKISRKGDIEEKYTVAGYNISKDYLNSLPTKIKSIKSLSDLQNYGKSGLSAEAAGTGNSQSTGDNTGALSLSILAKSFDTGQKDLEKFQQNLNTLSGLGTMAGLGAFKLGGGTTAYEFSHNALEQSAGEATINIYKNGDLVAKDVPYSGSGVEMSEVGEPGTALQTSQGSTAWRNAGWRIGGAIVGAIIGSQLGALIAKNQDWSPGKQQQFILLMSSIGGLLGTMGANIAIAAAAPGTMSAGSVVGAAFGATVTGTTATGTTTVGVTAGGGGAVGGSAGGAAAGSLSWSAVFGIVGIAIAVLYIIYQTFIETYEEKEYYIMQFSCNAWQPPKTGECNVCNSDVRPCSEYRCKSLGSNCHYFNENGDPGYCASLSDIWQAIIKPEEKILSEGNKYFSVKDQGFEIQGKTKAEVEAWKPLTFGITTDKQATCKIDTEHKKSYEEMSYTMLSFVNQETNKAEGSSHQITLSPHVAFIDGPNSDTTLPIKSGENEYYIRCKNFAGQVNEAEFTVQVKMAEGPDLTLAQILSTYPQDNAYLKQGINSTNLAITLDEPAECRYSVEYDEPYFSSMQNNMTCQTSKASGYYGTWPCFAKIENLTDTTKLFIKCKDQPGLVENGIYTRNGENSPSKQLNFNICKQGLEITSTKPISGTLLEINNSAVNLEIKTSGCINSGESICFYSVVGFGDQYTTFLETGKTTHKQTFSTLGTGNYTINMKCEDIAGNQANQSMNLSVYLDSLPPIISRVIKSGTNLLINTDEPAKCAYKLMNSTDECDFDFYSSGDFSQVHALQLTKETGGIYGVKCIDKKGNLPSAGCSGIFKILG